MDPNPDDIAQQWAKRVLRSEMAKRGLTYAALADQLLIVGVAEDERILRNKIARATFSAAFFSQCLAAMGCKSLNIDLMEQWREAQFTEAERAKKNAPPHFGKGGKES